MISAIDLFCGTGGLSLGLKQGGVRVVAGIDNAASCAYPYEENIKAKFVRESVREVTGDELKRLWGRSSVRLLAGCAPCQPFSSQRRGVDTSQEQSWPLLLEFGRLVRETTPDYVTMENVPRLQKSEVFEEFVSILRETGYQVAHSVLFGPDYGLPQRRRRLVLLAGRGTDVPIPSPTVDKDSYRTVSDAIQDLPPLSAGEHDPDDRLHFAGRHMEGLAGRASAGMPEKNDRVHVQIVLWTYGMGQTLTDHHYAVLQSRHRAIHPPRAGQDADSPRGVTPAGIPGLVHVHEAGRAHHVHQRRAAYRQRGASRVRQGNRTPDRRSGKGKEESG